MQLTEHFALSELRCKDGSDVPEAYYWLAAAVAANAETLRERIGTPLKVISGYRTKSYNASVGGKPRSLHLSAAALDLRSIGPSPVSADKLYEVYADLRRKGLVIAGGLGVYGSYIHIDVRSLLPQNYPGNPNATWDMR